MATLLALDTATENCSVALYYQGEVISLREICPREHSQKLLPMVDQVLAQTELRLTQLDAIAFGQGPGSFTGVRIAVSMMQGLALGADLPVIGISTLACMAQAARVIHGADNVIAAIDARMNEVYCAGYSFAKEDGLYKEVVAERVTPPDILVVPGSVKQWFGVGTGWQKYSNMLAEQTQVTILSDVLYPDAKYMLDLAQYEFDQENIKSVEQAMPVYLRDKVTWKKLPGR